MMNEGLNWELLARYLMGTCKAEELKQIETILNNNPEKRLQVEQMQAMWEAPDPLRADSDADMVWSRIANETGLVTPPSTSKLQSRIAGLLANWRPLKKPIPAISQIAAATILIALSILVAHSIGWMPWNTTQPQLLKIRVEYAQRQQLALNDGSNVVLDAGSRFEYPEKFNSNAREVYLSGEGFFEVTPNDDRPFIVHTTNATVQVLGTKFNVRAWEPDRRIQVAVIEGSVAFHSTQTTIDSAVILHSGEGSSMAFNSQPSLPIKIDIAEQIGWMNNEIIFRNVALGEVLDQIERWYNVEIELLEPSDANRRVTISLHRRSLGDILEVVSILLNQPVRRTGHKITLGDSNES